MVTPLLSNNCPQQKELDGLLSAEQIRVPFLPPILFPARNPSS